MPKGAGSSDGGVASADQVMDIDQFAEFMKISPRTVWRKLSTGELPPPITIGRLKRWSRLAVEAWIADRAAKAMKEGC